MPRMTPNQETLGGLNMKSKTVWIIALVAMPLLAAVFILHAQTNETGTGEGIGSLESHWDDALR